MRRFVTQYNDIWAHSHKSTYDSVPDRPEITLAKAKMDRAEKAAKEGFEETKTEAAEDERPGIGRRVASGMRETCPSPD